MKIREAIRSLAWADFISLIILDPRMLTRKLVEGGVVIHKRSFLVVLLVSLAMILSFSQLSTQTGFFYYKVSYGWTLLGIKIFIAVLVLALLNDLFFQLSAFQGRAGLTLTLLNYSMLPFVFILPGIMIFTSIRFQPLVAFVLLFFLAFAWSLYCALSMISELRSVGMGKALVSLLLPVVLLGALMFISYVAFLGIVFGLFSQGL